MGNNSRPGTAGKPVGYGNPPEATRFKLGQSGNPKGMKPGTPSFKAAMKAMLAARPVDEDPRTWCEHIVAATLGDALAHDGPSRKLVFEYIDGKPDNAVQELRHSGDIGREHGVELRGAIFADSETRRLAFDLFARVCEQRASGY